MLIFASSAKDAIENTNFSTMEVRVRDELILASRANNVRQ